MRFGLLLNEPTGQDPFAELSDAIAQAADDGFASAWMSNIFGLDALTALAVAGSQVPRIELGTAVVPDLPAPSGRARPAGDDRQRRRWAGG